MSAASVASVATPVAVPVAANGSTVPHTGAKVLGVVHTDIPDGISMNNPRGKKKASKTNPCGKKKAPIKSEGKKLWLNFFKKNEPNYPSFVAEDPENWYECFTDQPDENTIFISGFKPVRNNHNDLGW